MKSSIAELLSGIAFVVAVAIITEFIPAGGSILILLTYAFALLVAIRGCLLPLTIRIVATSLVVYFAYQVCLIGRTMEPFFSAYTARMALLNFALLAAIPSMCQFRAWEGRARLLIPALILPVTFFFACTVASIEESLFASKHRAGIGPTPRWTVSDHWLAYDSSTERLYGSD